METKDKKPEYVYSRTTMFYANLLNGIMFLLIAGAIGVMYCFGALPATGRLSLNRSIIAATGLGYLGLHALSRLLDKEHNFYKPSARASLCAGHIIFAFIELGLAFEYDEFLAGISMAGVLVGFYLTEVFNGLPQTFSYERTEVKTASA